MMTLEADEENKKISEIEKKNIKKQFKNVIHEFPDEEEGFEDSKAAKLAATSSKQAHKAKKERVIDEEE